MISEKIKTMEEETIEIIDMEVGMTYVRIIDRAKNYRLIFTFDSVSTDSPRDNIKYADMIRTDNGRYSQDQDVTVRGYHVRKAMVNEEVWLEECVKAKKFVNEDEAMALFMKRFENAELVDKKKIRVGYIDKEGKSKSQVVVANTLEEAMAEIPDLETVSYSVDA